VLASMQAKLAGRLPTEHASVYTDTQTDSDRQTVHKSTINHAY